MSNDVFVDDVVVQIELSSENVYYMLNETVDEDLNSFNLIDENDFKYNELNSETASVHNDAEAESDRENNPNRFLSTREQLEKLDSRMMDDNSDAEGDGGETSDKNDKWNALADELNEIGPARTTERWKKIWASRKHNKKKRASNRQRKGFISQRQHLVPKPSTQQQRTTSSNGNNGGARTIIKKNNCNCCKQTSKVLSIILEETRKTNDLLQKILSK